MNIAKDIWDMFARPTPSDMVMFHKDMMQMEPDPLTEAEVDELAARYEADRELHERLGREEAIRPTDDPAYKKLLAKIQSELLRPTFNHQPNTDF